MSGAVEPTLLLSTEKLRYYADGRTYMTPAEIKWYAGRIDQLEALLREAQIWCPRRGTMWSDTMHKSLSDLGNRIEAALAENSACTRPANKA